MIVGKMVRVRLRRDFFEQRLWVFVGKVVGFTEKTVMHGLYEPAVSGLLAVIEALRYP